MGWGDPWEGTVVELALTSGGNLEYLEGGSVHHFVPASALTDGNWHNVAVTRDVDGYGYLYVDGTAAPFKLSTSALVVLASYDHRPCSGQICSDPFQGELADRRVYSGFLTHSGVRAAPQCDADVFVRVDLGAVAVVFDPFVPGQRAYTDTEDLVTGPSPFSDGTRISDALTLVALPVDPGTARRVVSQDAIAGTGRPVQGCSSQAMKTTALSSVSPVLI